ncbi:metal-dependent hydrolase [Halobacteriales archaeon Cl-PHB]
MWPWEHLALGYLLYSVATRLVAGRPPRGAAVIVLAVATQVPDLVDKSLSWVLPVFEVGYAAGHSVLVVGPLLGVTAVLAARRGRRALRLTTAYAVGHLSHLLGDVVYPLVLGKGLAVERLFWPVATLETASSQAGVLDRVLGYFLRYLGQVVRLEPDGLFVVQVGLVLGVTLLWVADGRPGPNALWRSVTGHAGRDT